MRPTYRTFPALCRVGFDRRYGVTSLADLGLTVSMPEIDMVLRAEFEPLFSAARAMLCQYGVRKTFCRAADRANQAVQRGGVRQ